MKKKLCLNLLAALLFFSLSACKKDEQGDSIIPNEEPNGNAQSLYNGVSWDFDVYSWERLDYPDIYHLTFNHYNEDGLKRGEFNIKNVRLSIGSFLLFEIPFGSVDIDTIQKYCDFYPVYSDGDVVGDFYAPIDSSMILTVDQIDTDNRIISGRFWGKMKKKIAEMEYDPTLPDTIIFSEGTYEVKLD